MKQEDNGNKYGLTRSSMSSAVRREVRQRDGFGCVLCGCAIFDYEHIDPEFAEAKQHEVEGITLLCPNHHAEKTRKLLSSQTVKNAMRNPAACNAGWSFHAMDAALTPPTILLAGNSFTEVPIPILIFGVPLIRVEVPETVGGPYRISGKFYDLNGKLAVEIIRNHCKIFADNWDVTLIGGELCVREKLGVIALVMDFLPGYGIHLKRCEWAFKGFIVKCFNDQLTITTPQGGTSTLMGCNMIRCNYGIVYGHYVTSAANDWIF